VSVDTGFYLDGGGLRQRIRDLEPDGGNTHTPWSSAHVFGLDDFIPKNQFGAID